MHMLSNVDIIILAHLYFFSSADTTEGFYPIFTNLMPVNSLGLCAHTNALHLPPPFLKMLPILASYHSPLDDSMSSIITHFLPNFTLRSTSNSCQSRATTGGISLSKVPYNIKIV